MKNWTFLELTGLYDIEIPPIQRDYAQGRTGSHHVKDIRDNFLDELALALGCDAGKALHLNFIYGSTASAAMRPQAGGEAPAQKGRQKFIPLDGQQRLTTLFLLHWYLCPEEEIDCLRVPVGTDHADKKVYRSRMTYNVRISSKDFCNSIVSCPRNMIKHGAKKGRDGNKAEERRLSEDIINEAWFAWSWQNDPTINGMLTMLDAIDCHPAISKGNKKEMWERLKEGCITFSWMKLDEYNLTDDLYVKMNARGRELSEFDKMKSTVEQLLYKSEYAYHDAEPKSIRMEKAMERTHEWGTLVDNKWMNAFWRRFNAGIDTSNEEEAQATLRGIEHRYLRFLRRVMVYPLLVADEKSITVDGSDADAAATLGTLRDNALRNRFPSTLKELDKAGFLNHGYFSHLQSCIDCMFIADSQGNAIEASQLLETPSWWNMNDEADLLGMFTSDNSNIHQLWEKISYPHRAIYYALMCFCRYYGGTLQYEEGRKELNEWMRIMGNLVFNTTIDQSGACISVCQGILNAAKAIYSQDGCQSVLGYFAHEGKVAGMNPLQVREEQKKASLLYNPGWRKAITQAESHLMLRGRLRLFFKCLDMSVEEDIVHFGQLYNGILEKFGEDGTMKDECRHGNGKDNLLLLSFLSRLQDEGSIKWHYRIFNNETKTWRDLLTLSANDNQPDTMNDWKQSLWQILPVKIQDLEPAEHVTDGFIKQVCNPYLLNYVVGMKACWIRWYHGHWAIYPSSEGIFLDAHLRDAVIYALSSQEYGTFGFLSGDRVPETMYLKGNDIRFRLNGKDYEWADDDNVYRFNRYVCDKSDVPGPKHFSPHSLWDSTTVQ